MPYQGAVYLQNIKPDYGAGIAGLLGNAIAAYDKRRESEEKKRVQTISEIATLAELAGGYDEKLQNQMMQAYQPQQSRLDKLLGRQVTPFQMPTETVTTPPTTVPPVQSREFNIPGMPDIFSRFGGEQPSPALTASLGEDIPGFTVPGSPVTRPKKFMTQVERAAAIKETEVATKMKELLLKLYFESLYRDPKEFKPELFKTTTGLLPYEQAVGQMPYEESPKSKLKSQEEIDQELAIAEGKAKIDKKYEKPDKPEKPNYDVIYNIANPDEQKYLSKGSSIPKGWKVLRGTEDGTNKKTWGDVVPPPSGMKTEGEYIVGKIYVDAQGRKAKYLGPKKWQLQ